MLWSATTFPLRCRGFARAEHATQLVLGAGQRGWLAQLLTGPGIGATRHPPDGKGDLDVRIVTREAAATRRWLVARRLDSPPELSLLPGDQLPGDSQSRADAGI
jgi:hypothetical protein